MSVDIADALFDIEGVQMLGVEERSGEQHLFGVLKEQRHNCPKCEGAHTIFRGKRERTFLLPPVGLKKCKLRIEVKRCHCKLCKNTWWPQMPFTDGKQRMSKSFVNYALGLMKMGTISDVANHLGVGWDLVKDLHKEYLAGEYKEIDISKVKYIGLDEFSIRKRHKYMSVFSDLQTGQILHAVEGRKKEDVKPFMKELKKKQNVYKLLLSI